MQQLYPDDAVLIRGCLEGNPRMERALYDKYKRGLMGICYRYADRKEYAQDIFQEGFIKVFKSLTEFRVEEKLYHWLSKIMVNTAINYYRQQIKFIQNEGLETLQNETNDDEINILQQLTNEDILQVLHELPSGYRIIFNLYIVEGYQHTEIAEMLHISESTSKSQLMRARIFFKKKLDGIALFEQRNLLKEK